MICPAVRGAFLLWPSGGDLPVDPEVLLDRRDAVERVIDVFAVAGNVPSSLSKIGEIPADFLEARSIDSADFFTLGYEGLNPHSPDDVSILCACRPVFA
jgi:hypothetical protein